MSSDVIPYLNESSGSVGSSDVPSPIVTGVPVFDSVEREICCLLKFALRCFSKIKNFFRK